MERAATFSAVPGRGGVVMGLVGLLGGALAVRQPERGTWLAVWIGTAITGFVVAAVSIVTRARRARVPLLAGPGRKFAFALAPSLVGAVLLTAALVARGQHALLPAVWLLLYGTALLASATFSIPPLVPMGLGFFALGIIALGLPGLGDIVLMAGFGGLQIGFGFWIWRHYGG
jgi:hypothetical protein